MNITARITSQIAVQPHVDLLGATLKQISAEVREYLKAVKAAWNEPLTCNARMSRQVEQQMQKAYLSGGLEAVDHFIDAVNRELKLMGFDAGIGRGVACELKDGASDRLHFYFEEFSSQHIIGRYTFSV